VGGYAIIIVSPTVHGGKSMSRSISWH